MIRRAPEDHRLGSPALGPYRIGRLLGSGGLGEVYEAWDERLHRWVALKRLLPRAEGGDHRRRLLGEARAAARLDHSAIVRIYDLLEGADGDWIVMERVEGETLARRLLRAGPLEVDHGLELAEQLAGGLAYAHAKGLIHRDLKAENVMLGEGGAAKLLDFGLALDQEATRADTVERAAGVVGTVRAMAPEQAMGRPVDGRSDLFSFGVLLYEALTGSSPFLSATAAETLARVCTLQPPPVRELRPEVPDGLSLLIERLLEKDPACRLPSSQVALQRIRLLSSQAPPPHRASELGPSTLLPRVPVGGPLAADPRHRREIRRLLAGGGLGLLLLLVGHGIRAPSSPGAPRPLQVTLREVEAEGAQLSAARRLLQAALALGVERSLIGLGGVAVRLDTAAAGSSQGDDVPLAVDAVVETRLRSSEEGHQVTLRRLEQGKVVRVEAFGLPAPEAFLAIEAAGVYARRLFPESRPAPGLSTPRAEDLEAYLELRAGYEAGSWQGREEELLRGVSRLREGSPGFVEAHVFEADLLASPALRNPQREERARDVLAVAQRLAPQDPRPLLAGFRLAIRSDRTDEAADLLARLEALRPGSPELLAEAASLAWSRGRTDESLELQARAVRLWPTVANLYRLASLEVRAGRSGRARASLQALLTRTPDHLGGLWLLAQLELLSGSPRRAAELYRLLSSRQPGFSAVANLGVAELLSGNLEASAEALERALELRPTSAASCLGLADVRQLQGRRTEAAVLYERTLGLLEAHPEGVSGPRWQQLTIKAQALAHLKREVEAAEAVREALRLAPDEPQLAFEASLVYSLLGERSSAVANARRALQLGVAPTWFQLPWFESLRPRLDHLRAPGAKADTPR